MICWIWGTLISWASWAPMVMGATSGRVGSVTLPRLSPRIWEMKSSRFQPESVIRDCLATDSRPFSLVRSPSTPLLRSALVTESMTACWRLVRSKAPLVRPCRWRTKASALFALRGGQPARAAEKPGCVAVGEGWDRGEGVGGVAGAAGRELGGVAGVQGLEAVVGQDVGVPVGPALQAHQQDVLRADGRAADDRVRAADGADVLAHEVGKAADGQHERGGDTPQDMPRLPGGPPPSGRRACPCDRLLPPDTAAG